MVQPPRRIHCSVCTDDGYVYGCSVLYKLVRPKSVHELWIVHGVRQTHCRKRVSAAIVSSGRSSRIQCPVSLRTTTVTSEATSFACAPSASPNDFSPPIE